MRLPLLLAGLAQASLLAAPPLDEPKALDEANNLLAWELHRAVSGREGNGFLSPLSIGSAMGMVAQGAKGATLDEIRRVLRQPLPPERQHAAFGEHARSLVRRSHVDGQELAVANAVFQVGFELAPAYRSDIARDYGAEIFTGDLGAINRWVDGRTRGMIPKLVDQLPAETAAVVLNAVYFKGTWASSFAKEATQPGDFLLSSCERRRVPMMRKTGRLAHLARGDFRRLTLPYGGGDLAMHLLLPAEGRKLAEAETALDAAGFAALISDPGKPTQVDVALPRFRLATEYRLKAPFARMGMSEPFSRSTADLSGMGGRKGDLWIDDVIHKAVVEVDEVGTKAAAVTGVVIRATAFRPDDEPVVFHCDQPFLFAITSGRTVLFLGRVADPGN